MRRPELLAGLVAALLLQGCARPPLHVHTDTTAVAHQEFLMHALLLDPPARERLWQRIQRDRAGAHASLRRALLRTVPGHAGYDLALAETELQAAIERDPGAQAAAVAAARLEDLRAARACRAEVETLKRRLSKVADLERRQDEKRR